jgi:hypothetical protein
MRRLRLFINLCLFFLAVVSNGSAQELMLADCILRNTQSRDSIRSIELEFTTEARFKGKSNTQLKRHVAWWDHSRMRHDVSYVDPMHPLYAGLTPDQKDTLKTHEIRRIYCKNCTPTGESVIFGGGNAVVEVINHNSPVNQALQIFDPRFLGGFVGFLHNHYPAGIRTGFTLAARYESKICDNWTIRRLEQGNHDIIISNVVTKIQRKFDYYLSSKLNYNIVKVVAHPCEFIPSTMQSDAEYSNYDGIWYPSLIKVKHIDTSDKVIEFENLVVQKCRINQPILISTFSMQGFDLPNNKIVHTADQKTAVWEKEKLVAYQGSELAKLQPKYRQNTQDTVNPSIAPTPLNPTAVSHDRWYWLTATVVLVLITSIILFRAFNRRRRSI